MQVIADACWGVEVRLLEEFLWDRKETALLGVLGFPLTDPRGRLIDPDALDIYCAKAGTSRRRLAEAAGLSPQALYGNLTEDRLLRVTSRESSRITQVLSGLIACGESLLTRGLFPRFGQEIDSGDLDDFDVLF